MILILTFRSMLCHCPSQSEPTSALPASQESSPTDPSYTDPMFPLTSPPPLYQQAVAQRERVNSCLAPSPLKVTCSIHAVEDGVES